MLGGRGLDSQTRPARSQEQPVGSLGSSPASFEMVSFSSLDAFPVQVLVQDPDCGGMHLEPKPEMFHRGVITKKHLVKAGN